ncbi:MAG: class I SAM-dependent methyltransferase [Thiobacillus sp.]|nr:class I SAM-dependent methyltransferase [Thiobacillus sp.]
MNLPRIALLPTFLREWLSDQTLPREPEPDAIMTDAEQVAAFSETGRSESTLAASYLFHTARASQTLQGCKRVVDLGCGPATQLIQIATLNPEIEFIGVDMSQEMLRHARAHAEEAGVSNVSFMTGDITKLEAFEPQSVDGVISTVSLHHLPTAGHLEGCFREIRRILKPGGAVYLADFGRLKSLKSVIFFAYMNRDRDPHQLLLDYERSLRAAFLLSDFKLLAKNVLDGAVNVFSTFKVPLLILLKTQDKPLPADKVETLNRMRNNLNTRFRYDLDDMRTFFKLGGLKNDVFR